jgi:hypothetical protein
MAMVERILRRLDLDERFAPAGCWPGIGQRKDELADPAGDKTGGQLHDETRRPRLRGVPEQLNEDDAVG